MGVLYKNGKQFDASWDDGNGKPISLPLTGVIKGWQQGIPGMRVGGRRELIIRRVSATARRAAEDPA